MIFPIPYTKGSKVFPIIGVSTSFDATLENWPAIITNNLAGTNGQALVLDTTQLTYHSIKKTADVLYVKWETLLERYYDGGYAYVLIPKFMPEYPTYTYYCDIEPVDEWINGGTIYPSMIEISDTPVGTGFATWLLKTEFEYDSKVYDFYCIKSYNASGTASASSLIDFALIENSSTLNLFARN